MSAKDNRPDQSLGVEELRALLLDRLQQTPGLSPSKSLSFAQQRLWFLDQLQPNTPLYNIPCIARLHGRLDIGVLEQSLNIIVERHETLRTRFVSNNGVPAQVVDHDVKLTLEIVDLARPSEPADSRSAPEPVSGKAQAAGTASSGNPKSGLGAEADRLVREEAKRPFDLSQGPLFRAKLVRLGPEEHVLVLNMHHIISDEWSLKLLFRELSALYMGFVAGQPVSLPELPIQYSDYAVWQQEWLQGEGYKKQLAYWKEQLKDAPAILELPSDYVRQSTVSSLGAWKTHRLGRDLAQQIRELAGRHSATPFMVLLAAFKVLLHRYSRQDDLVLGTPMAGRTRIETEGLIGLFVNTVPLRSRLAGDPTFLELLEQVRGTALEAYSHQELPFEKLVQELHPERSLNQTPLVNVMFLLQNQMEKVLLPGLEIEFIEFATDTAKFDLTLGVAEFADGLEAGFEYRTELFEEATIARFLQQYESLLQGIVADPTRRLSELPLLSESDRRLLLADWSQPAVESPPGQCLHQWFEAQAEKAPDVLAATCEQESITYRELNRRANQLANYLARLGTGPETPVALLLDRSLEMIVAILAVLKAGGTYVPMDPAYPQERLRFMLEDTQAPILLTKERLRDSLPACSAELILLDAQASLISACPSENPPSAGHSPEQAAYIIYTSGSTGRPKGVIVTHYNVVRLFKQTEPWYGFDSSDVWTLFHSYTFDFSVWELWGALLYGGRLVVVPYLVSRSPAEFYDLLAKERVTVLNQTPSAFRQLLWAEANASAMLPLSLRYVIFGGEALELQSLKPWFERHGDEKPRVVNMYGITETTVHVTYRPVRQADLERGLGSVIGVPIPDLRLCLLDERLQPVPPGLVGEICVGGAGVARGYLNRPELTAQRFIADPYSEQPGARLYRSGDLARFTSQGELEYLGRMDHQVKIRGFRVELGEIESALHQHPAVRESIVIAGDGPGGAKRLVAYVVPKHTAPEAAGLREYLGRKMPDYMVPSALVFLPALPLTPNGKVDRRALPQPESAAVGGSLGRTCVPPRNPTEAALVEIWCQLLGRPSVCIHENFFDLGGHSLLATQVVSRIAATLKIELPVRTIFESPTVAMLAQATTQAQPANSRPITRHKPDALLERLEQLSDTDLAALLQHPILKK